MKLYFLLALSFCSHCACLNMDVGEKDEGSNGTEWNHRGDLGWAAREKGSYDLFSKSKQQESLDHSPTRNLNVESNSEADLSIGSNQRLNKTDMFAQCTIKFGCATVPSWLMQSCCNFCAGQKPGWWMMRCMTNNFGGSGGGGGKGGGSAEKPGETTGETTEEATGGTTGGATGPPSGGGGGNSASFPATPGYHSGYFRQVILHPREVRKWNNCGWGKHCIGMAEMEVGMAEDVRLPTNGGWTVRNCVDRNWWNCYGWSPWDSAGALRWLFDNSHTTPWKYEFFYHGFTTGFYGVPVGPHTGGYRHGSTVDRIRFVSWDNEECDLTKFVLYGAKAYVADWGNGNVWWDQIFGFIPYGTSDQELDWKAANSIRDQWRKSPQPGWQHPYPTWQPVFQKRAEQMQYAGRKAPSPWCRTTGLPLWGDPNAPSGWIPECSQGSGGGAQAGIFG